MIASRFPLLEAALLCHLDSLCQALTLSIACKSVVGHQDLVSNTKYSSAGVVPYPVLLPADKLPCIYGADELYRADEQRIMTPGNVSHNPIVLRESDQPDSRVR